MTPFPHPTSNTLLGTEYFWILFDGPLLWENQDMSVFLPWGKCSTRNTFNKLLLFPDKYVPKIIPYQNFRASWVQDYDSVQSLAYAYLWDVFILAFHPLTQRILIKAPPKLVSLGKDRSSTPESINKCSFSSSFVWSSREPNEGKEEMIT